MPSKAASATSASSGTASTSPSPNSGVVRRRATTLASAGTCSGVNTKVRQNGVGFTRYCAAAPMAWSCSSEPPLFASGSKAPYTDLPNRVSRRSVVPPMAPVAAVPAGPTWQAAHEFSLKIGPRPSPAASTVTKAVLPLWKAACCSAVSPGSGSPKPVA